MTTAVANPLLALTLTGSASFAGWVAVLGTLPSIILQLPAGFLVDRIRRWRKLMAISQAIRLLFALTFSISLFYSDSPHIFLLVAVTVNSSCTTIYTIAEMTSVRGMVPKEKRNLAAAQDEARGHISQAVGRSLGGYIFGFHRALPYAFEAIASSITLATLIFMGKIKHADPPPDTQPEPEKFSLIQIWHHMLESWKELRKDAYLSQTLAVCVTASFLLQVISLLLLVQATNAGYSSAKIGCLLASSGIFGIIGAAATATWLTPEKKAPRKATNVGFLVWAALMLLIYAFPFPTLGMIFWGMFSAVGAYMNIALRWHQMEKITACRDGKVISIVKFTTGIATTSGALIAGYAVENVDPRRILMITTTAMVLAIILVKRQPLHEKWRWAVSALRNSGEKRDSIFSRTTAHDLLEPAKPIPTSIGSSQQGSPEIRD